MKTMLSRLYKRVFRKSYAKIFSGENFLIWVGLYVTMVQSKDYERQARVALLWSAITVAYMLDMLSAVSGSISTNSHSSGSAPWNFLKVMVSDEDIAWIIFGLFLYYATRFVFSVVTAFSFINPLFLIQLLYRRKKFPPKSPAESIKDNSTDADRDIAMCGWMNAFANAHRHAQDDTFGGAQSPQYKRTRVSGEMQSQEQVRSLIRNPIIGLLENLFGRVIFPVGVCAVAFVCFILHEKFPLSHWLNFLR